jgi:hypothetical protein
MKNLLKVVCGLLLAGCGSQQAISPAKKPYLKELTEETAKIAVAQDIMRHAGQYDAIPHRALFLNNLTQDSVRVYRVKNLEAPDMRSDYEVLAAQTSTEQERAEASINIRQNGDLFAGEFWVDGVGIIASAFAESKMAVDFSKDGSEINLISYNINVFKDPKPYIDWSPTRAAFVAQTGEAYRGLYYLRTPKSFELFWVFKGATDTYRFFNPTKNLSFPATLSVSGKYKVDGFSMSAEGLGAQ